MAKHSDRRPPLAPLFQCGLDFGRIEERTAPQLQIGNVLLRLELPKKPRTYSAVRKKNLKAGFRVEVTLDA